jgi:hypothetical protein
MEPQNIVLLCDFRNLCLGLWNEHNFRCSETYLDLQMMKFNGLECCAPGMFITYTSYRVLLG